MIDFERWLNDLSTQPLPGGVAAAAVASAMGGALVAKATRLTLRRQLAAGADARDLQVLLDLAAAQQAALLRLAGDDERAYSALLETRPLGEASPERHSAWREATEVPLRVAEACHALIGHLTGLHGLCWPPVQPDLQAGIWLLETGRRTGLLAAQKNLEAWGEGQDGNALRARIEALK
jgi:formiminotetrahydrofolate cyclodeaminase